MNLIAVRSLSEFDAFLQEKKNLFLLLYKSGSEISECALKNLTEAMNSQEEILVLTADVNQVRDIHMKYGITSVPVFLTFENGNLKNMAKGCNTPGFFKNIFNGNYNNLVHPEDKPRHHVTVYSTPTCTWCNTLKAYLRQHKISFRDIDVSKDENAAREMVRRSGQQGVPQTIIDGQLIVGFDKAKINRLLGINVQ